MARIWGCSCPALLQFGVLLVLYGIPTFRIHRGRVGMEPVGFVVSVQLPCAVTGSSSCRWIGMEPIPSLSPSACRRHSQSLVRLSSSCRSIVRLIISSAREVQAAVASRVLLHSSRKAVQLGGLFFLVERVLLAVFFAPSSLRTVTVFFFIRCHRISSDQGCSKADPFFKCRTLQAVFIARAVFVLHRILLRWLNPSACSQKLHSFVRRNRYATA